ncbi:squalene/phytoene synthase family protein [Dokdonella sp.]|uniref:squalene/phytoene synthase family protein n=1 Tax=Dokdonella sp. TaxID=2291710 RepID=UPI003C683AC0
MAASTDALASFEEKWSLAHPELPLALRFVHPQARPVVSALACLSHEVGLAAFRVVEVEVATGKLRWWAEELALLPSGQARHPLTQVLAGSSAMKQLPADTWTALIAGAFAQRDAAPARGLPDLIAGHARFHEPLGRIESAIYPALRRDIAAQAGALSRIVHESARLPECLTSERLPLPLDLLARHGLSRSDLGVASAQRDAALREHFAALWEAMKLLDSRGLSPLAAARLAADLQRCRRAARAEKPLESSAGNLDRLPLSALWACWRAARRMQPSV